jgi:uncharacterized protein (DUF1330 family)
VAYGYVLVDVIVSNPDEFKKYAVEAPASARALGGEYLVRGDHIQVLEGQWSPSRLTVIQFPSFDVAKQWYDSEQYSQARAKRAGTTSRFNMVLVEGVQAPI